MQQNEKNPGKDQLSDEIDSPHDREELREEAASIGIPDVHDIPGQEDFIPAPLGEVADTTISSADEEGNESFDDNLDEEIINSPDSNVSEDEQETLGGPLMICLEMMKTSVKPLWTTAMMMGMF